MARNSSTRRRETNEFPNRRLPPDPISVLRFRQFAGQLSAREDRRTWHPEGPFRSAASLSSTRHRLKVIQHPAVRRTPYRSPLATLRHLRSLVSPGHLVGTALSPITKPISERVAFVDPRRVITCIRRRIREEVLHALRKTGKTGQRRPKWTEYSHVSCGG